MKSKIMKSGILILWIVVLLAGLACASLAAISSSDDGVTLDLKDADIRSAIESLFRGTNRGFIIADDVMGTVTMYMPEKQPFDIALKVLLKAKSLVYKIDNGIYIISRKQAFSAGAAGTGGATGGATMRGMGQMGNTTATSSRVSGVGGVGGSAGRKTGLDDTLEKDMIVDKIPLNYIGASEMIAILNGYTGGSSGGYGNDSGSGSYGSSSGSSRGGGSSNRSGSNSNRSSSSSSSRSSSSRSSSSRSSF